MTMKAGLLDDCDFVFVSKHVSVNTYGVCVLCGSRDDPGSLPGTAHFLEHMIFTSSPSQAILQEGGYIQAMTERERTFYICHIPNNRNELFNRFLRFLHDPHFSDDAIQQEKNNIMYEYMTMQKHQITDIINALYKLIFPYDGLGNPVLGYPVSIESIRIDDLVAFHRDQYRPSNIIIVQTGSKINSRYSPNGNRFFYNQRKISCPVEINSEIPNFGWEVSPSNNNIYLIAFPVVIHNDHDKHVLVIIKHLLTQFAEKFFRSHNDCRNPSFQFSFQCKHYNTISILFCLIAGSVEVCRKLFSRFREMIRFILRCGFNQSEMRKINEYDKNQRIIRGRDPVAEIYEYMQNMIQCVDISQLKARALSPRPLINENEVGSLAQKVFMPSGMHYYSKCKADMYNLPYILHI